MTKYNINVLMVMDEKENLLGYITRQIMEKAVYFGLGDIQVKEYMNIEYIAVAPETPLNEIQDLIIKNRLRILPVMENGRLLGVITRTDLLNILVGGPVIPDFLYESRHSSHFIKKKNISSMLKERLPRRIISLLKEFGQVADSLEYKVYLVGGLVRDVFLKRENLDVDIVVEGDGIKFAYKFASNHEVRVRSHKKFGTAVLIFPDGSKIDIATARMEYYETPAALPMVSRSSLKMDLFRRDFTINTLSIKLNRRDYGTLIDYFGAQKDLREKVIRVLNNLSFVEDPTRVFRAIRFEQRFGFRIAKLTLSLMKNAVDINSFRDVSGRRIFIELRLILMEGHPLQAIERMNEFRLLQFISPEIKMTADLKKLLEEIERVISWFKLLYLEGPFRQWQVYWHGLTSQLEGDSLNTLAKGIQMNDLESRRMIEQRMEVADILDKLYRIPKDGNFEVYSLLSRYDTEILLFAMARSNNERTKRLISNYFTKLRGTTIKIHGTDLLSMGFTPGPVFRKIFSSLLKARLNDEVSTREDEIGFIKENFKVMS